MPRDNYLVTRVLARSQHADQQLGDPSGQAGAGPVTSQGDSAIDPGVIKRMLIKCADIRHGVKRVCGITAEIKTQFEGLILINYASTHFTAAPSNPARPLNMCREWAERIAEEYFAQVSRHTCDT